ncbi:hypothetical protein [Catenovulum sediminis]|uniref:AAA domain-containing protein n=1 Tax=Catenovulum sediminis TaxID=1740262 RepID=A0ABV1RN94_9ALTE|nr:hypothetical protein [Catenovulum sediminis]
MINAAFSQVKAHKTLYILIDEAHLLEIAALRKLRLLFERLSHMDVVNVDFAGAKIAPKKS